MLGYAAHHSALPKHQPIRTFKSWGGIVPSVRPSIYRSAVFQIKKTTLFHIITENINTSNPDFLYGCVMSLRSPVHVGGHTRTSPSPTDKASI